MDSVKPTEFPGIYTIGKFRVRLGGNDRWILTAPPIDDKAGKFIGEYDTLSEVETAVNDYKESLKVRADLLNINKQ